MNTEVEFEKHFMVEIVYLIWIPTKAKTETREWWTEVIIWIWVQEGGLNEQGEWVREGEASKN